MGFVRYVGVKGGAFSLAHPLILWPFSRRFLLGDASRRRLVHRFYNLHLMRRICCR